MSFEALRPCWNGFFKDKVFYSYHRCRACGILFCRDFFTPAQLDALYAQMPDNTAGVPLAAMRRTQAGYFRALRRHSDLTGEFLEVGPDIGLFTECAVREGRYGKFWLFEPNAAVKGTLERVVAGRPHVVHAGMFDFNRIPDGALSAAVMIHVLDHIVDPKPVLAALKKKLSPSAVLLFVTHDESSLLAKLTRARWPAYCLQHPHLFSPRSMTALLEAAGYKVLEIGKSANHFPVMYLAKHLLWAAGVKKFPLPALPSLALPLKLGNILTVAAPSAIP
jgi:hypothetical protein